jgi:hypothetical protein
LFYHDVYLHYNFWSERTTKQKVRVFHLFLYSALNHSKSSAMMTVIAEVGIHLGGTWRWHWRRRWYYEMARFGRDVKVGGEWAHSQKLEYSPLRAHVEPPTESHTWRETVPYRTIK